MHSTSAPTRASPTGGQKTGQKFQSPSEFDRRSASETIERRFIALLLQPMRRSVRCLAPSARSKPQMARVSPQMARVSIGQGFAALPPALRLSLPQQRIHTQNMVRSPPSAADDLAQQHTYPMHVKEAPLGSSVYAKVEREGAESVREAVRGILSDIELNGHSALDEYAVKFDGVPARMLTNSDIEQIMAGVSPQQREDIAFAQDNVRRFAELQRASLSDVEAEVKPGVFLGHKNLPMRNVLCYVPGVRLA